MGILFTVEVGVEVGHKVITLLLEVLEAALFMVAAGEGPAAANKGLTAMVEPGDSGVLIPLVVAGLVAGLLLVPGRRAIVIPKVVAMVVEVVAEQLMLRRVVALVETRAEVEVEVEVRTYLQTKAEMVGAAK